MEKTKRAIKVRVTENDSFLLGLSVEDMHKQNIVDNVFLFSSFGLSRVHSVGSDCEVLMFSIMGTSEHTNKLATITYFVRGEITAVAFEGYLVSKMKQNTTCTFRELLLMSKDFAPAGVNMTFSSAGKSENKVYQQEEEKWSAGFCATSETLKAYGVDTTIFKVRPLQDIKYAETYHYVKERNSESGTDFLDVVSLRVSTKTKSVDYVELTISLELKEEQEYENITLNFVGFLDLTVTNGTRNLRLGEANLADLVDELAEDILTDLKQAMYIDIEMVVSQMAKYAIPLRLEALV